MKKILLSFVFAIALVGGLFSQISMNNMSTQSRPPIFGASPFQDSLWAADTVAGYNMVYSAGPTLAGFTLTGITGLTMHPHTGEYYVIMKVSGVSGRVLGKFNPLTGTCTQVGNLGDNFSTISFREDGQLFGVTGDGASVPETMYLIDHTNGSKTIAAALGAGADGEVIAFNYDDDFFYHWSGNGTVVMEKVMSVAPYTATNIPISGPPGGETFGSVYLGGSRFLIANISSNFLKLNANGTYGPSLGVSTPDDIRGLGLVGRWVDRPGSATICFGDSALFEAFATQGGSGRHKFQWLKDGVSIPGATSSTYYATQSGWYNCRIVLDSLYATPIDSAFTGSTDTAWYGRGLTVNIQAGINPSPTAYICPGGGPIILTSSYPGSNQWYFNGVLMPGETNDTLVVSTLGNYNVTSTFVPGCVDTSAMPTVVQVPPATTLSAGSNRCFGDSVLLTSVAGASNYNWLLNGSVTGTTSTEMFYATTSGNYSVETTFGSCLDTSTVISITFAPAYNVTPAGAGTICMGNNQTLNATGGGSTYQWLMNGTPIGGATSASYNATATGTYSCIITFPGCTDTTVTDYDLTVIDCSGIEENASLNVNIYPNPVHDKLNISVSNNVVIEKIEVVDLTGRKVMITNANGSNISLGVETLRTGTYLINVITDHGIETRRFVKY